VTEYHLAQLNIVKLKFAIDAPELAGFFARFEEINALADESPGFVWRLPIDDDDATAIDHFGPDYLVNMSVWADVDSLHGFVYRSTHTEVMARRKLWFDRTLDASSVLWWIPVGTVPTIAQADERLQSLRQNGPTTEAFTFKQIFHAA
jgi:hypothetical protein